jgi:mRNA-degrading endonuclease toxin of MazEF toxin-antitoxin module
VFVSEEEGMQNDSWVNLDSIQTVATEALVDYWCSLSAERMVEVDAAARFALQLEIGPDI